MYIAICRYDATRAMEIAFGTVADDDLIAGTIAFVSWLHLCYVCSAMRMHFYGLIYLIYHISYMFGYVGGENAIRCPIGINSTGFDVERIFNESTRWHSQKEGRLFATVFTRRNTQTKLNSSI
ncbi:uncharacterized protein LOC113239873 isoform X2 [Hyposmocoma kahamanoa]|uniref:uncharacterized protein LOC113239873 isoform X2 n=1 Tax=Hyposmocoma kahamanoa TaxID=1477025 RepID=UPI000E6D7917|nr:uncharacterized protein LOC113239873 isoform X2 [Hyposmocoma kahamanoa]